MKLFCKNNKSVFLRIVQNKKEAVSIVLIFYFLYYLLRNPGRRIKKIRFPDLSLDIVRDEVTLLFKIQGIVQTIEAAFL